MKNNICFERLYRLMSVIVFPLLLLTLCACEGAGSDDEVSSVEKDCTVGETLIQQTMQSENYDEVLKKYFGLYKIKEAFRDSLNPTYYLLIGEGCAVGIQIVPGLEQSTVINYPVERIETNTTESICSLRLFDKTGKCLTFMTTEDECSKILDMIE